MVVPRIPYNLIILVILGILTGSTVRAQNNSLYFMNSVPQVIHLNPALFYNCKTYIELPIVSSVRFSYANTGFGYHDAIHYGSGTNADSLLIDMDNLEKKLKNRNYIRNDVSFNILGAGFNFKEDYYVHFNISTVTENWNGFPGDLVALKDGNWDVQNNVPRDINLSGLGVNGTSYLQIAAGVSTEIMSGLYVGATLKYLKGAANIRTQKADLVLETESDPIRVTAQADYRIKASFPMDVSYDDQGFVNSINIGNAFSNPLGDYILNKNHGAGIDLGVIYEYDDKITLAASLLDLGFIRWGSNMKQFEGKGTLEFEGFDLRDISSGGSTDFLQILIDTIRQVLQFSSSENPYYTGLMPKLYAGATYQLLTDVKVSALTRTDFFDRRPHLSITLSGMYSPLPFLHGTLSYSIMNNRFDHIGAGLAMGGKGGQFYIVADHIPVRWVRETGSGLLWPYNARTVNIRLGVNILFGCDDTERGGAGRRPGSRSSGKYCPAYD